MRVRSVRVRWVRVGANPNRNPNNTNPNQIKGLAKKGKKGKKGKKQVRGLRY